MSHPRCVHPAMTTPGLTDDEFWALVYPDPPDHWEPDIDDYPELTLGPCIRCGVQITAGDYEEASELIDAHVDLCDDCAGELLPDEEVAR